MDWGDYSELSYLEGATIGAFSLCHTYYDDGQYLIVVTVSDDDGGADTETAEAMVGNLAPIVGMKTWAFNEGMEASIMVSFFDASPFDLMGLSVQWGDGSGEILNGLTACDDYRLSHLYADDGVYSVVVMVSDGDGGSAEVRGEVVMNNVAPLLTVSGGVISENEEATVSGTITDPCPRDSFTLVISWGDGAITTQERVAGSITYSASHRYLDDDPSITASDRYSVVVSIVDDDGGSGAAMACVEVPKRWSDATTSTYGRHL